MSLFALRCMLRTRSEGRTLGEWVMVLESIFEAFVYSIHMSTEFINDIHIHDICLIKCIQCLMSHFKVSTYIPSTKEVLSHFAWDIRQYWSFLLHIRAV